MKQIRITNCPVCSEAGFIEPCIGAIRGRKPDNPKSRKAGFPTQQMLEINESGVCNTLTTVQKDNVVVEPIKETVEGENTQINPARVFSPYGIF